MTRSTTCFSSPQSFSGHRGSVVDISYNDKMSSTVVTSSEDKSIRLWDLRSGKTCQCITGFGENPVNIIKFAPFDPFQLFGLTDNSVIAFDLRREGVIVRDAHKVVYTNVLEGMGEDNDLCSFDIHFKESLHLLAVGDENGIVSTVDWKTGEVLRRLSRVHTNVIGSVVFQPGSQKYLCSGGFDSRFCCWDFCRGRPSGGIIDYSCVQYHQQQVANPPFVHDLMYIPGHEIIVGAFGDGSLHAMKYIPRKGYDSIGVENDAHGGMVTSICHIGHSYCRDDELCQVMSTGIDCSIKGWNLSMRDTQRAGCCDDTSIDKSKTHKRRNKSKSRNKNAYQLSSKKDTHLCNSYAFDLLFEIQHDEKINAISCVNCINCDPGTSEPSICLGNSISDDTNSNLLKPSSLGVGVADVTNSWKLYSLKS